MPIDVAQILIATDVEKGLGWLQTIISGGPALILACLVVVLGIFAYRQLKKNGDLEQSFREKIEGLLREMLDRDREAQEAITAAVSTIEGFTVAMKDQRTASDATARLIEDLKRLSELQSNQVRALEDELRRGRSA